MDKQTHAPSHPPPHSSVHVYLENSQHGYITELGDTVQKGGCGDLEEGGINEISLDIELMLSRNSSPVVREIKMVQTNIS